MKTFFTSLALALPGLAAIALACAQAADAAVLLYTDRTAFLAALASSYYLEPNMSGNTNNYNYSSNGFSYSVGPALQILAVPISSPSGDISTATPGTSLDFTFGPGVRAFGGYFYNSDYANGDYASGALSFNVSDGSTPAFTLTQSPASNTAFYGFIADADLTTASITSTSSGTTEETYRYPTAGSVIVGTNVAPSTSGVPAPLPLAGATGFMLWSRRLRRRISLGHPVA